MRKLAEYDAAPVGKVSDYYGTVGCSAEDSRDTIPILSYTD
jgi:hypothetical protein